MKVPCKHCKTVNTLKISEHNIGKKVRFKCANPVCHNLNQVFVSEEDLSGVRTVTLHEDKGMVLGALLEVLPNPNTVSAIFHVEEGLNIVGRASSSKKIEISIKTTDRDMSREHCQIEGRRNKYDSMSYTIEDLDSKNGVYINGIKLEAADKVFLEGNDIIELGNTSLLFLLKYKSS